MIYVVYEHNWGWDFGEHIPVGAFVKKSDAKKLMRTMAKNVVKYAKVEYGIWEMDLLDGLAPTKGNDE